MPLPHLNPMATGDWKADEVLLRLLPPLGAFPFRVLHFLFQSPKKKEKKREKGKYNLWLPDCCSQIFRKYVIGPWALKDYGSAKLRCKI